MHLIPGYLNSCPEIISRMASVGGTGVHVFFLCSGFGLYYSYKKKPLSFPGFIRKRFLKIYLPYIVVVLISACIPFMFSGNRIKALLSHVFLYKMFMPKYEMSLGVQFWFVSTLFQFYMLFIPLCRIKKDWKQMVCCSSDDC